VSDDVMGGHLSTRTTLCLLAGAGALTGGVAGAAIVGKLATDGAAAVVVASEKPAAASSGRVPRVAIVAAQSPSRQPTPWSAADAQAARAAGERHRAVHERAPSRVAVKSPRISAAPTAAPASSNTPVVLQTSAPPTADSPAAAPPARAPVEPAPQTSAPARSPAPARAPEPAPKASRPSPEAAPAHTPPKPDPTGAFDDSG
jgi:hypothetical protein